MQKQKNIVSLFEGPYRISKQIGQNSFVLVEQNSNNVLGTYNRANLRPYYEYDKLVN